MRGAPASIRFGAAALLALLLALRSLAPAGFMPAFDHGSVTIVVCPGTSGAVPAMSGHGDDKSFHQPCPYAAASALSALAPGSTPSIAILFFAVALLLGRTFLFVERSSGRERPPSRGPPILA
ncbi:DUF2946 family protein [Sphingomonas segetis]|jgi:hypothetical protein|uniref:DUF2946 family protein n=1 Tax=Sphingomonas segetis TaxID=1104779 RepID=UPI0018AD493F|nr:DUF2946 family protein [Sphingomonas segetis]